MMRRLTQLLEWLTAFATIGLLLALALGCIDIYMDGNVPDNVDENGVYLQSVFSQAYVASRLSDMTRWFVLYVLLIIITSAARLLSTTHAKVNFSMSAENRLLLMKARVSELPFEASCEEKRRLFIRTAGIFAALVCLAPCAIYLFTQDNFISWDLTAVMFDMIRSLTPWMLSVFAIALLTTILYKRSCQRELQILKSCIMKPKQVYPCKKEKNDQMLRIAIMVLAITFIVLGVMNGGLHDVLVKAINICTECIGLG